MAVDDEGTQASYEAILAESQNHPPDALIVIEDGQEIEKDEGPIGGVLNPIIDNTGEAIDKVRGPVDRYLGEKADAGAERTREWVEAQKSQGILGNRSKTAKDVGLRDPTSEIGQRATREAADIGAEITRKGINDGLPMLGAGIIHKIGGGTKLLPAKPSKKGVAPPRGSHHPHTRARATVGQEAHRQLEKELQLQGYETEVVIKKEGLSVRKDAVKGNETVIIKPETPSGQRAAQKRSDLMKKHGFVPRVQVYDPNDPRFQPGSATYVGPKKKEP